MCRLLPYLGPSLALVDLVEKPEFSLVLQSYRPQEMTSGLLNADGFGFGWYDPGREGSPFRFRSTQPIWGDANFPALVRYIHSHCLLANVRSATPGQAVDLSNCQPFCFEQILAQHNGFIENFRQTLYRPIRDSLDDIYYKAIDGSTDSEHLFAFVLNLWQRQGGSLTDALAASIRTLADWAAKQNVAISLNLILSDGEQLVASRYANRPNPPSLYWLNGDLRYPDAFLIASEPLTPSEHWKRVPAGSILTATPGGAVQLTTIG